MKIFQYLLGHWHELAYIGLVVVALVAYVFHFFKPESKVISAQSLLMIVLLFVVVTATRMEQLGGGLHGDLDILSSRLDNIEKMAGYARIEKLDNADLMFSQLLKALSGAQYQINVTSIRSETPTEFKSQSRLADQWYSQLRTWADQGPGRKLYRIIGIPDDDIHGMKNWFDQECKKRARTDNYILKSFNWSGKSPVINMVVFDQRESFLVFSPPSGLLADTEIYHIVDSGLATIMVNHYFASLLEATSQCP